MISYTITLFIRNNQFESNAFHKQLPVVFIFKNSILLVIKLLLENNSVELAKFCVFKLVNFLIWLKKVK